MPEIQKKKAAMLNYLFNFGSDGDLYTVSFKGAFSEIDICRTLEAVHPHLLKTAWKAMYSYLRCNSFPFSDFKFETSVLSHENIMACAWKLLHAGSSKELDQWIGNADFYYGIMDCQKWSGCCCDGCCYAVRKVMPGHGEKSGYRIIGQTFQYQGDGTEQTYFSIREQQADGSLYDIETVAGNPVIPTFGSLDMINLLLNISKIQNSRQAAAAVLNQPSI